MPSVAIPLEWIEDTPEPTGAPPECYTPDTAGPFASLLWFEVRHIERAARMTVLQAVVFEWHLRGIETEGIAGVIGRTPATVTALLNKALNKAGQCRHIGLITCLIESFGWPATLSHIFEQRQRDDRERFGGVQGGITVCSNDPL